MTFGVNGIASMKEESREISSREGLYRVGLMDADRHLLWLTYVGQTGRDLRERLGTLRRKVYDVLKPVGTHHVAAPVHWDFRHSFLAGQHFECSVFELPSMEEDATRKSLESLAITLWRQEHSLYPLVNFGSITMVSAPLRENEMINAET